MRLNADYGTVRRILKAGTDLTNTSTARLADMVYSDGPAVKAIARKLGEPAESVRYRFKHILLKNRKGYLQAAPDRRRLGLKPSLSLIEFNKDFEKVAPPILIGMNKLGYLTGFSKTTGTKWIVRVESPAVLHDDVKFAVQSLVEKGIFKSCRTYDFDYVRFPRMMTEFYNFQNGTWDYAWATHDDKFEKAAVSFEPSEETEFDYLDLLILKEFQIDATRNLKEIAVKLDIPPKRAQYHMRHHVIGRRLIQCYRPRWTGNEYNQTTEKLKNQRHRYLYVTLTARNLTKEEIITLRQTITNFPFLWAEFVGKDTYAAEIALPLTTLVEGLGYLGKVIGDLDERAELLTIDEQMSLSFTIPYEQYDKEAGRWAFDRAGFNARFDNLVTEARVVEKSSGTPH